MSTFIFTLKHDLGKIQIRVMAQDEQVARMIIIKAESCPPSAIIKTEKV